MYYFLADLHLSESEPAITAQFLQFLQNQAPFAQGVYILGDLFDFWIGDDEQSPLITTVKQALKTLTDSGVPCFFLCGNRDFLIGKRFAAETGVQLLPDYQPLEFYGKKWLLCHGDTLCVDDVHYQKFRRKVHHPLLQKLFLCLPLALRLRIAERIRAKSQRDKQHKTAQIMDVNPEFTAQIVRQFGADFLIHGHTHRQAIHKNGAFTRIVLGDWHADRLSLFTLTETGFQFND